MCGKTSTRLVQDWLKHLLPFSSESASSYLVNIYIYNFTRFLYGYEIWALIPDEQRLRVSVNRALGRTLGPLTGRQTTGRLQKTVQPSDLHNCHSSSIIKKEMNRRGMQHASMLCNVPLYLENQKRPRGNFRHVWEHIKANSEQNGWEDTDWSSSGGQY